MSSKMEKQFFKQMNNSVYGKTIIAKFNNAKKHKAYKNELLG